VNFIVGIIAEDRQANYINLLEKWNKVRRDKYYVKNWFRLHPEEREPHIREVDAYELNVYKSFLYDTDKKKILNVIRDYREDYLNNETRLNNHNPSSNDSLGGWRGIITTIAAFAALAISGGLLYNEYRKKSEEAREIGYREGFSKKIDEILKRYDVKI